MASGPRETNRSPVVNCGSGEGLRSEPVRNVEGRELASDSFTETAVPPAACLQIRPASGMGVGRREGRGKELQREG